VLKQIDKDQWDEVISSIQICTLPLSVQEVEKKLCISFFEYEEQGLGKCFGSYLQISGSKLFLMGVDSKQNASFGVVVHVRSFEKEPIKCVQEICYLLEIKTNELRWINPNVSTPKWVIYKLDGNGNEVEAYRFLEKRIADAFLKIHGNKEHKQIYHLKEI
jgi:hypothetical protein